MTIEIRECGRSDRFRVDSRTFSTADGRWSVAVRPSRRSVYRARWQGGVSGTATVRVRPNLSLTPQDGDPDLFGVSTTASQSFAGERVVVQQFDDFRDEWRDIETVTLRRFDNRLSFGVIRIRAPNGTRLRAVKPAVRGSCYAGVVSAVLSKGEPQS